MKKALRVTFGTIIAAGVISVAQAHEEYYLNNTSVWIAGTYFKTSNNGLSVGDVITSTTTNNPFIPFDGVRPTFLEPGHNWDFSVGLNYNLHNSPANVFLSYDHYSAHDARSDGPFFTNLTNLNPVFSSPLNANATVHQRADEVRLGLTREIFAERRFCVEISGFAEYDRIKREVNESTSQLQQGPFLISRTTENKMRGIGPGVGAMGRVFPFARAANWSFFAGIMNTLLFAKEDYHQNWNFSEGSSPVVPLNIDPEQSEAIINKTDINFGVEYFCFINRQPGNDVLFNLALGMRYVNYNNAFKNGNMAFNFDDDPFLATPGGSAEDWGRWGPYIQLTIGGAGSR